MLGTKQLAVAIDLEAYYGGQWLPSTVAKLKYFSTWSAWIESDNDWLILSRL